MQIRQVKISNLLSFPYYEDLAKAPDVNFYTGEKSIVNILIGPNGAGKSNFLQILNQILTVGLMKDYTYDKTIIKEKQRDKYKEVITCNNISIKHLEKHFLYKDKPSHVEILISIGENDMKNCIVLAENQIIINKIIEKYSNISVRMPDIQIEKIKKIKDIVLNCEIDTEKKTLTINEDKLNDEQKYILLYLKNQELIQIAIDIHNHFEVEDETQKLAYLRNTFSFIGLHRNFSDIELSVNPNIWNEYISSKNSHHYYSFIGYYLCIHKLRHIVKKFSKDINTIAEEEVKKILNESTLYKNLQQVIALYMNKTIDIQYVAPNLSIVLKDKQNQIYSFKELSLGEQSFLIIILTIYGYDLKNGLLFIDEPEIHFHPQMQKRFMDFLEHVNKKIKIQCILSTYSPIFINEENIYNVYRFSKKNLVTSVRNPSHSIHEEESDLIHILKYGNTAKIFFVDKIIMVEGETDGYFFEYYLNYLKNTSPERSGIANFEIVNINGKWAFRQWRSFLSKFWLETYFIGDRDNIVENHIINETEMNFYRKASHRFSYPKGHAERYYTKIVEAVKKMYPNKYQYILNSIKKLYNENVFILQHGDLETYMGTYTKGLNDTVQFCHTSFKERLNDPFFNPHREEMITIFKKIFALDH